MKMFQIWLILCILFYAQLSTVYSKFSKDGACGVTKGCYSDCDQNTCTYLISWSSRNASVMFTIIAELSNSDQYVSVGFSHTQSMDGSSVTSCLMTSSGTVFTFENSYNKGHHNNPVTNPTAGLSSLSGHYVGNTITCTFQRSNVNADPNVFDLTNDYYILYAAGPVSGGKKHEHFTATYSSEKADLQSVIDLGEGNPTRIKAHGIIAIFAWMVFGNLGMIIARYYKPILSSKTILGSTVWFLLHRILMLTGTVLTITAFSIIIHGSLKLGENSNFKNSHPFLGITILCLVVLNPIIGFFRPDKSHRYRPIFYWTHFTIGIGSLVLASINIFIGVQLKKSVTAASAFYLLIAFEVCRCSMIAILEVLHIKENHMEEEMEDVTTEFSDQQKSKSESGEETQPYAWKIRRILLVVHMSVTIAFAAAVVIIIGTSTSSGFQ